MLGLRAEDGRELRQCGVSSGRRREGGVATGAITADEGEEHAGAPAGRRVIDQR